MKLHPISLNSNEVTINNDLIVLFSYQTPVACMKIGESGKYEYFRTDQHHSKTTSKHINKWWNMTGHSTAILQEKEQEFFDNLVK